MATNDSTRSSGEQPNFEQALATLEAIVHELEEGQIGLAEALARYEQGVKLLRQCYQLLEHAERRIELLSRVSAAGEPITQPLDDSAISLQEKAETRGKRRSRPAADSETPCAREGSGEGEIDVPGGLF